MKKSRNIEIDVLKGILTLGMVLAHVIQFLYMGRNPLLKAFSTYTNLVSFTGFYACFGFSCWLAYFSQEKKAWKRMVITAMKCYLAFIISGFFFQVLVVGEELTLITITKIIFLRSIPYYSDFLVSFSLVLMFSALFSKYIRLLLENKIYLSIILVLIIIFAQFFPHHFIYDPYISLWIGGAKFGDFPVILYFPVFLIGAWMAKNTAEFRISVFIASVVLVTIFTIATVLNVNTRRFPPSGMWLVFSLALLYIYYACAIIINKVAGKRIIFYLVTMGRNVLFYLLISNLILFSLVFYGGGNNLNWIEIFFIFMCIMLFLSFQLFISTDHNTVKNMSYFNE